MMKPPLLTLLAFAGLALCACKEELSAAKSGTDAANGKSGTEKIVKPSDDAPPQCTPIFWEK